MTPRSASDPPATMAAIPSAVPASRGAPVQAGPIQPAPKIATKMTASGRPSPRREGPGRGARAASAHGTARGPIQPPFRLSATRSPTTSRERTPAYTPAHDRDACHTEPAGAAGPPERLLRLWTRQPRRTPPPQLRAGRRGRRGVAARDPLRGISRRAQRRCHRHVARLSDSNWAAAVALMRAAGSDEVPATVTASFEVRLLRPTPTGRPGHAAGPRGGTERRPGHGRIRDRGSRGAIRHLPGHLRRGPAGPSRLPSLGVGAASEAGCRGGSRTAGGFGGGCPPGPASRWARPPSNPTRSRSRRSSGPSGSPAARCSTNHVWSSVRRSGSRR